MKTNFIKPGRLVLCALFFLSSLIFGNDVFGQTGSASGISTFQSIGLYWSGSGGSASTVCNVQYRVAGSGSAWKNGYPLVFDNRAIGGRPANEYRGSLVNLTPGTTYEILLTAGSATNTINVATWSENFPVASTTTINSSTTISTSGTAAGYRVYTGSINGGTNNIVINASYVIIRNMTLTGAGEDAIIIGTSAHHVVIEGCDISGWGYVGMGSNNQGAVRIKGFSANATNVKQVVIQRCKLHDSRDNSNSWDPSGHPLGPNAITFDESGGNHVIRYNEIYNSSASKKFMDGIGGGDNFTYTGAPGANSDIYGNIITDVYDDAIEAEGSGMNIRVYGNWMSNTFTGIATATVSIGPMYVYNNVYNLSVRSSNGSSASTIDNEDRGPFNKCGTQETNYRGGRTFLFHNTILQPVESGYSYPRGAGGGPVDNGGPVANVYSRNNIWQTYRSNHPTVGEWQSASNSGNTYDYDLYNGNLHIVASGTHESHGVNGTPSYIVTPTTSKVPNTSGYFLSSASNGVDDGLALNNFNDGYTGAGPDIGAYEIGKPKLEFGVLAYLNTNPVIANAGTDVTVTLPNSTTTLTGSGTTTSGTITSYAWTLANTTASGGGTIGNPNTAQTGISGLLQGTYTYRLTVTNSAGVSATDDVIVTVNAPANQLPTANAGSDQTITLPMNTATLLGSGTDPDGTIVSYAWTKVSPTGGTATISNPTSNQTGITGLTTAGTYRFRLTVTDNSGGTATDDVIITVNAAANQPPTANAGSDQNITLPGTLTLIGSGTDPDGTIASHTWTKISPTGGTATITNPANYQTGVTGLTAGTYIFRLTVTDNNGATAFDEVTVVVNPAANQPPTVNAGNNITVTLPMNTANLSGSATDPDGTIATHTWTLVSTTASGGGTISNPALYTPGLSGLLLGVYTYRLTVTDNSGATAFDEVIVTVNPAANQPPTVNAGNNITVTLPMNTANLSGSATDPDGTIATHVWTLVSTTASGGGAISSTISYTPQVTGLLQGVYTYRLTVTDNSGATAFDEVTVTVNGSTPTNQAPIAIAGNNVTLNLPANSTSLNGQASFDPDGTIASYAWTKVSGPAGGGGALSNANTATPGVSGLLAGTYVYQLTVTDNNGATDEDNITIVVSAIANIPPIANAGNNITLTLPLNSTNLNGGASSDPDGIITTYTWTKLTNNLPATIENPNQDATGISGLVQGVYTFRLTVTDNDGASSTDDVVVTVNAAPNQAPVANAGSDITITLPINSTMLTGTGYDADGTISTYAWSWVSGPQTYTINNPSSSATGLTGLIQGTYVFRLTVTDNRGATATDVVTVVVNQSVNQGPTANAGADITITLPTNSTTLYGSGADPDGTIATYTWAYVSGPAGYTIANTASATTGIYSLVKITSRNSSSLNPHRCQSLLPDFIFK